MSAAVSYERVGEHLCAPSLDPALLDRLLHHATTIRGDSITTGKAFAQFLASDFGQQLSIIINIWNRTQSRSDSILGAK